MWGYLVMVDAISAKVRAKHRQASRVGRVQATPRLVPSSNSDRLRESIRISDEVDEDSILVVPVGGFKIISMSATCMTSQSANVLASIAHLNSSVILSVSG